MPRKRVILNLSKELVEKMDEQVKKLGLPSRNAYVEQVFRREVGLPHVFTEEEG